MHLNPAVVVVAFIRPGSLNRLLTSLNEAYYPRDIVVRLCLCLDFENSLSSKRVQEIASKFNWQFGPKEVIVQSENIGLKKHVLQSGDLVKKYGAIIMLEDDLFVSPNYYQYAVASMRYFGDDATINGISLYNHKLNFSNRLPFIPLDDGSDIYFLQVASSWGQVWTDRQWSRFRDWYLLNPVVPRNASIPQYVIGWPDKSWLKHFIHFLAETDSYFVYPRVSLSTNFGEVGQNSSSTSTYFQVPLLNANNPQFRFTKLTQSLAVYDAYFDLDATVLQRQVAGLRGYQLCNNLSGLKVHSQITEKYVLVQLFVEQAVKKYGIQLKPIEDNIIRRVNGEGISLVLTADLKTSNVTEAGRYRRHKFKYYHGLISFKKQIRNLFDIVYNKLFK